MEINVAIIAPVVMILLGIIINMKGLKYKSSWGFRTRLSLKSQENWDIAQKIFAKWSLILGTIGLAYSFIIDALKAYSKITLGTASILRYLLLVLVALLFILTERDLKKAVSNDELK